MPGFKHALLLFFLLLLAGSGWAQSTPPAAPPRRPRQLTVRLTLPTAVGAVGEFVGVLKTTEKSRLRRLTTARTSNPVLVLTVPLPRWLDKEPSSTP